MLFAVYWTATTFVSHFYVSGYTTRFINGMDIKIKPYGRSCTNLWTHHLMVAAPQLIYTILLVIVLCIAKTPSVRQEQTLNTAD